MLWIRIGFNADPDPGSQTNADHEDPNPDPGKTLKLQKVKFLHEKYNEIGIRSKNIRTKVKYPIFKAGNQFYFKILVYFHAPGSGSAFTIPNLKYNFVTVKITHFLKYRSAGLYLMALWSGFEETGH